MLEFLIENGSDVNIADRDGNTPLHATSLNGLHSFLHICLCSIHNSHWEFHKILIFAIDIAGNREMTEVLLTKSGINVNAMNNYRRTPLHYAVIYGKMGNNFL